MSRRPSETMEIPVATCMMILPLSCESASMENCMSPTTKEKDWRVGKSMQERYRYMLEHRVETDVMFVVGGDDRFPGETIRAHSFILKVASSVFDGMLNSDETWKRQPIKVDDVNPRVFKLALEYMYCDSTDIDIDMVSPTLYVANKYKLHELRNRCEEFLMNNICEETACEFLDYANIYNMDDLSNACLQYIDENTPACLNSEGFTNLSPESMRNIISRDSLSVNEADVFESVMHWSWRTCKKRGMFATGINCREILGDDLYFVRLPLIDPQVFTNKVVDSDVLSDIEKVLMFRYFYAGPTNRPKIPFSSKPRKPTKTNDLPGTPMSLRSFPSYPSLFSSTYFEGFTQTL